ncbi:hypothetical protein FOA52_007403 [Chlamydomonas sp. UWO 241]|nr:hypothetical protein FOA52_007403 [Chlamydomonas sp. UWO 241]
MQGLAFQAWITAGLPTCGGSGDRQDTNKVTSAVLEPFGGVPYPLAMVALAMVARIPFLVMSCRGECGCDAPFVSFMCHAIRLLTAAYQLAPRVAIATAVAVLVLRLAARSRTRLQQLADQFATSSTVVQQANGSGGGALSPRYTSAVLTSALAVKMHNANLRNNPHLCTPVGADASRVAAQGRLTESCGVHTELANYLLRPGCVLLSCTVAAFPKDGDNRVEGNDLGGDGGAGNSEAELTRLVQSLQLEKEFSAGIGSALGDVTLTIGGTTTRFHIDGDDVQCIEAPRELPALVRVHGPFALCAPRDGSSRVHLRVWVGEDALGACGDGDGGGGSSVARHLSVSVRGACVPFDVTSVVSRGAALGADVELSLQLADCLPGALSVCAWDAAGHCSRIKQS